MGLIKRGTHTRGNLRYTSDVIINFTIFRQTFVIYFPTVRQFLLVSIVRNKLRLWREAETPVCCGQVPEYVVTPLDSLELDEEFQTWE